LFSKRWCRKRTTVRNVAALFLIFAVNRVYTTADEDPKGTLEVVRAESLGVFVEYAELFIKGKKIA